MLGGVERLLGMSRDKRRSIFGSSLTALTSLQSSKDDAQPATLLRKRRTASFMPSFADTAAPAETAETAEKHSLDSRTTVADAPPSPRPGMARGNAKRASSVFSSFRGLPPPTPTPDDDEPLSATSARASAFFGDFLADEVRDRQVLRHGEVQTSSSMFRKKKEYLVLTEKHLVRFKTSAKAAEAFPG